MRTAQLLEIWRVLMDVGSPVLHQGKIWQSNYSLAYQGEGRCQEFPTLMLGGRSRSVPWEQLSQLPLWNQELRTDSRSCVHDLRPSQEFHSPPPEKPRWGIGHLRALQVGRWGGGRGSQALS